MEDSPCLVCSEAIKETHCGFEICRACAAFFKRTQKSGRHYICRQGNGNCKFRKREKFTCRYCRFARCKAIGMKCMQEPSSILKLIKREYEQSEIRRMTEEMRLVKLFNLKVVNDSENLYQINLNYYYAMYPIIIGELEIFLRSLIPDFDQFSDLLRASIFRSVVGKFIALECYFRTSKKYQEFGKCMCTLLTCFYLNDCDEWVAGQESVTRKRDLLSALRSYATEYLTILHQTLKMGEFTETEFHALIAIAFCDMDATILLPDKIYQIFESTRSKVFVELQNYYREELKISDYSTRLGSLMTVSAVLSEFHNNSHVQLNLYAALFDVKPMSELLREAMK